jgi:hypothetical protein
MYLYFFNSFIMNKLTCQELLVKHLDKSVEGLKDFLTDMDKYSMLNKWTQKSAPCYSTVNNKTLTKKDVKKISK